jgi:MerR family transcriptional regulator, light-induced transcriptional regulator
MLSSICLGCVESPGMSTGRGAHRIGEFAQRVGVSPELLRAWEQRYGLLNPVRSSGGFRLYGEEDAARVARMRRALDEGLSAAQAAQVALEGDRPPEGLIEDARRRLLSAIERYDEAGVQAALDDALAAFGLETFVGDLILPTLAEIGRGWQAGEVEVSQEHFASNLIRGRLLSLARLWGRGAGPLALLACAPGEQHDMSLLAFGLLLRSYGWRVLFLGANTPIMTLTETAQTTAPAVIVLVSFDPGLLKPEAAALRRLARIAPLFLSGPGATESLGGRGRVQRLDGDVISAAEAVVRMSNSGALI